MYIIYQLCLCKYAGAAMCLLLLSVNNISQIALAVRNFCMHKADKEAWIFDTLFLLNRYFVLFCWFTSFPCFAIELLVFFLEQEWATCKQETSRKFSLHRLEARHGQALSLDLGLYVTLYYEWKIIIGYIYYRTSSACC